MSKRRDDNPVPVISNVCERSRYPQALKTVGTEPAVPTAFITKFLFKTTQQPHLAHSYQCYSPQAPAVIQALS